jgi:hypothetical protein
MRGTWVFRDGRLVEKGGPLDVRPERARSEFPSPSYISDGLPDLIGPGGRPYSSKSELRREYKARGLVELGNDAPTTPTDNRKRVTKAEIGEALQKVKQGYKPAPLETSITPDQG